MVRGVKKNDIDDICLMIFVCRTLNNNNLTSLPRDLFEPLSRLRVLRLSENKWLCDCHLAWLGRFLRRHARAGSPLAANGYLPRCHAPFGLRIKAVSELLDTEFKCTGKSVIVKKKNSFFSSFSSSSSLYTSSYKRKRIAGRAAPMCLVSGT
jgi:hypothetical protein